MPLAASQTHAKTPIHLPDRRRAAAGAVVSGRAAAADSPDASARQAEPPRSLHPTLGGKQFWTDELFFHQWRIQHNARSGEFRLLDADNFQHASGGYVECRAKLEEIKRARHLAPMQGKVVIVLHGLFRTRTSMDKLVPAPGGEGRLHRAEHELRQHAARRGGPCPGARADREPARRRRRGDQLRRPQPGKHRGSPLPARPGPSGRRPAGRPSHPALRDAGAAQPRLRHGGGPGRQRRGFRGDRPARPGARPTVGEAGGPAWARPLASSASSPAGWTTSTA